MKIALRIPKALLISLLLATASARKPILNEDGTPIASQNATVRFFATASLEGCPSVGDSRTLSVAPETCISGSWPLLNNIQIETPPVCSNGEIPVLVMYPRRGCHGRAAWHTNRKGDDIPETCLSAPDKSHYWSFAMRCGLWAGLEEGGDAYIEAPNPGLPETDGVARPGKIETWLGFSCTGHKIGRNTGPVTLRPDQCMTAPHYAMEIQEPAVCANGTRALWARFPGRRCNMGVVMNETGLVDIADRDIGTCLDIAVNDGPGKIKQEFESMSFWCDGWGGKDPWPEKEGDKKKETTKSRKGSVSDNNCWTDNGPTRASTWMHADADTCWGLRPHAKMYLSSNAKCENGTEALLAYYPEKGCAGKPEKLMEVKDEMMKKCLSEEDYPSDGSYAFWCTGDNKGPYNRRPGSKLPPPNTGGSGNSAGSIIVILAIMLFVLVVVGLIGFCFFAVLYRTFVTAWNAIKAMFAKQDGAIRLE